MKVGDKIRCCKSCYIYNRKTTTLDEYYTIIKIESDISGNMWNDFYIVDDEYKYHRFSYNTKFFNVQKELRKRKLKKLNENK